jgi:hypothetical protein
MYGDNLSNAELYALNSQSALAALSIVEKKRTASFQVLELTSPFGDVQDADQITGYVCTSSIKRKAIAASSTNQSLFRSNTGVVHLRLSKALDAAEELSTICRLLLVEEWNPVSALFPSYIANNWDLNWLRQPENVNEAPVGQTFAERAIIANDSFVIKMALHFKIIVDRIKQNGRQ